MNTQTAESINVQLSRDEVLVLFEYLNRWCDSETFALKHPAGEKAFLAVGRELDRRLSEPFASDYAELMEVARQRSSARYGQL